MSVLARFLHITKRPSPCLRLPIDDRAITRAVAARLPTAAAVLFRQSSLLPPTQPSFSTHTAVAAAMSLKHVQTDAAPKAVGPYSQAVVANGFVFCSGQIPLDPKSMELVPADIKVQTQRCLDNLDAVLKAAGSSRDLVVKAHVFLKDMETWPAMNEVYTEFFGNARPARVAVEVARLPKDVMVEIECTAVVRQ